MRVIFFLFHRGRHKGEKKGHKKEEASGTSLPRFLALFPSRTKREKRPGGKGGTKEERKEGARLFQRPSSTGNSRNYRP